MHFDAERYPRAVALNYLLGLPLLHQPPRCKGYATGCDCRDCKDRWRASSHGEADVVPIRQPWKARAA
jgi:hypothetical protein